MRDVDGYLFIIPPLPRRRMERNSTKLYSLSIYRTFKQNRGPSLSLYTRPKGEPIEWIEREREKLNNNSTTTTTTTEKRIRPDGFVCCQSSFLSLFLVEKLGNVHYDDEMMSMSNNRVGAQKPWLYILSVSVAKGRCMNFQRWLLLLVVV